MTFDLLLWICDVYLIWNTLGVSDIGLIFDTLIIFYSIRRKYRFYRCLSNLRFALVLDCLRYGLRWISCIFWIDYECWYDVEMLFMRCLFQALWLDLKGVCTDRIIYVLSVKVSVECTVVCLRVCYWYGFLTFEIGVF